MSKSNWMFSKVKVIGEDVEPAVVTRIVPGRLVYVRRKDESVGPAEGYPFKLDKMVVVHRNGTQTPYRGERLTDLLTVGSTVGVANLHSSDDHKQPTLFVEETSTIGSTIGSTIANFARNLRGS